MKLARMAQLAAAIACATTLTADYRYEETTKVTGGTILRMSKFPGMGKMTAPTTSTHYYKGGKSASVTGSRIDIIDADKGVFTVVNMEEKTYATITFEEFKAALEAMARKAQQQNQAKTDGEMTFDLKVRDLGASKTLLNMEAKGMEMKLTMTMTDKKSGQSVPMDIISEMFMAKELPGSQEQREFQLRMAKKIEWDVRNSRFLGVGQMQPGFTEGMQKFTSEARKLEGTPLMTVTKMMGMGGAEMPDMPEMSGPSSSDVSDAAARAARDEASRESAYQTSRAAGGRFGGLAGAAAGGLMGGFGKKKPKEQPKEEAKAPAAAPPAQTGPKAFMETTSEILSYSSAPIDAAQFEVPRGFKEVEHDMKKALKGGK
jgi:hypothetical protein